LIETTWNSFPKLRSTTSFSITKFKKYFGLGATIADLGCGYGRICLRLEQAGFCNIIGLDESEVQLSRADKHLKMTRLIKSNVIQTPLLDESVDGVISFGVMSSFVNSQDFLMAVQEVNRIMKAGGFWFFNDFTRNDSYEFEEKYKSGFDKYGVLRQFDSNFGITFRHYSISEILTAIDPYFNLIECTAKQFHSLHLNKRVAGYSLILQKVKHTSSYR